MAKAALECGLNPIVFEARQGVGGLWRAADGLVPTGLRTNLSKWTCSFSDHFWPADADDFPSAHAMENYLRGYATRFDLSCRIAYSARVTAIERRGQEWVVRFCDGPGTCESPVQYLAVCGGVFARPFNPWPHAESTFGRPIHHTSTVRDLSQFANRRVAVLGSSFSALELAGELASQGASVLLVFRRPVWVLPRRLTTAQGVDAPADLIFYTREIVAANRGLPVNERNLRRARFFEHRFGNPGDWHPDLSVAATDEPPFVAISDVFLQAVGQGFVRPRKAFGVRFEPGRIVFDDGTHESVDEVVIGSGFSVDLSFLPEEVRRAVEYDPSDRYVPFVADHAAFHPQWDSLAFIGMYRGPFFGTMELQARWAAMVFSGRVALDQGAVSAGLEHERRIRSRTPRAQFPHSDYVAFADSLAARFGAEPQGTGELSRAILAGPVVPAHYRLCGPNSAPTVAAEEIRAVCKVVSFEL